MKRLGIVLGALILLASAAGGVWWWNQPRTPADAFERASKTETRLLEKLRLEKESPQPDAAKIAALDLAVREVWEKLIERWGDSPEADQARYRLLTMDLEAVEPGKARLDLIEAFLKAHPEHEKTRELMWRKAETLRDELKDPLGAVQAFAEIEKKFPDDPMAPQAALASARIYDAIEEPAAAARAYAELAEKYPNSPEAEQALMRQAALLEEKLDQKRAAAEIYREVAEANPGSAMGRQAQGRRKQLLGEMGQSDQDKYYDEAYQFHEFAPYDISQEEFNSPTRLRIRAQGFDVEHYAVDLRLDPVKKELSARTKLRGVARKAIKEPLLLELSPTLKVGEVTLAEAGGDPVPVKYEHKDEFLEIALPAAAQEGERPLELSVAYAGGVMTWNDDSITTEAASLWGETRWYPQTHLGDMYTQDLTVEYPDGFEAVAQGRRLDKPEPAPEGTTAEGWNRASFTQDRPGQFMTLAVGRFNKTEFKGPGGVPMEIYVAEGHEKSTRAIREAMERSVNLYIEMLGEYPFEKLAVAEVPEFPGGYGSASLILLGTITFEEGGGPEKFLAHEIAHQWFGNLLGLDLQDGSIPWLSEGFATYCDAVFTERTAGKQAFLNQIRKMGNFYRQNALLFEDRPISQTLWRSPMYRSLMYEKGGLVLHELRREMGDDDFFRLLREFVSENRFEIVRIRDFSDKASAVAGRPLDWFFEQTLDRTGYPSLALTEATAAPDAGRWNIALKFRQKDPSYRMKLEVAVDLEGDREERATINVAGLQMETALRVMRRPLRVRLDPDAWHLLGGGPEELERAVALEGEDAGESEASASGPGATAR